MLIKKLAYVLLTFVLLISWIGSVAFAVQKYYQSPQTIAELSRLCQKHVGQDGTADVTIGAANFQNQSGEISVPCTVYVRPGSTFQMSNVTITSKSFAIGSTESSHPDSESPIYVILKRVKLTGKDGNFQIDTSEPGSTVLVQDSTIDYPNLVGISVGSSDTDSKSSIEFTNNTVRSMNPENDGIWLVSSGKLVASNNQFDLADPDDIAAILGGKCQLSNNSRANQSCPYY